MTKQSSSDAPQKPTFLDKYFYKPAKFLLYVILTLLALVVVAHTMKQIWRAFRTQTILVEGFSVGPELDRLGYSPQVVANLIVDRCVTIVNASHSGVDLAEFSRKDEKSQPDIEVPETHTSLKTFVYYVTDLFGHRPVRVTGDIAGPTNHLTLTVRIDSGAVDLPRLTGSLDNLEQLLDSAATNILRQTHPYDLACSLYENEQTNAVMELLRHCVNNGEENDRAWAHILWGVVLLDQNLYEEATNHFAQATKFQTSVYRAYCNLAGAALSRGSDRTPESGLASKLVFATCHWIQLKAEGA